METCEEKIKVIIGTEEQIKWAQKIKEDFFKYEKYIIFREQYPDICLELKNLIEIMRNREDAVWWINNRQYSLFGMLCDHITYFLKQAPAKYIRFNEFLMTKELHKS